MRLPMSLKFQSRWLLLLITLIATPMGSQAIADDAVANPAVIAFRIEMSRLMDSRFGGDVVLPAIGAEVAPAPGDGPRDLDNPAELMRLAKTLQTVSGQISLPSEFGPQAVTQIKAFIVLNFSTAEAAANEYKTLPNFQEVEIDGKSFKQIGGEAGLPVVLARLNDKTVDIGTREFMVSGKRNFATPALVKAYLSLPKSPVRIALDFDGNKEFVKQGVDMLIQEADPVSAEMIRMLRQISTLGIHLDPDGNEMLAMTTTSHNAAEADTIKTKLSAVIGLAKANLKQIPVEQGRKLATSFIKSTSVQQADITTTLSVKKPANFEAQVKLAVEEAQAAAKRVVNLNNGRQVALAFHNYHDTYRRFPFEHAEGGPLNPGLSWQVAILPFVEQAALYEKFDHESGWDSDQNKPLAKVMPEILKLGETGQFSWVRPEQPPKSFRDILDGTSNTIVCIQNPKATEPWTKPSHVTIDQAVKLIKGQPADAPLSIILYDGSVRRLAPSVDEQLLRNLLDPKDGNVVGEF